MSSKVKIFAASASKKLALSIAENFGQPLGETSIVYFSDGEFEPSFDELRYSIGVGVTWITGFGPMSFSFSQPFNDGPFDKTEEFQFTIGTVF